MPNRRTILARAAALAVISATTILNSNSAHGDWRCSPGDPLNITFAGGDDVQPKIVVAPDGSCYISWFENSGGGYDVRLQRLDARGSREWDQHGILIADRSFSSTQDYGLAIDGDGHAVLAFRDDRFGGARITAQRVSPGGDLLWGDGVTFGDGVSFVAAPKVAATDDGEYVIGWTSDDEVQFERIDIDGEPVWTPGATIISDPGGASLSLSDLNPSAGGAAIASWIRSESFFSPRHLYAQRLNSAGGLDWGNAHVAVFDGGSIQLGNFPTFLADGAGGGVFSWYDTASSLQSYVQRIGADGLEVFSHNGVAVATLAGRERVSPRIAFDSSTETIFASWTEMAENQSLRGVYAQRFDESGERQWGDSGVAVVDVTSADYLTRIELMGGGAGAVVIFSESLSFGNDSVRAALLDGDGEPIWEPAIVDVGALGDSVSRLATAPTPHDSTIIAWQSGGAGVADILAQSLKLDGLPGYSPVLLTLNGTCPGEMTASVTGAAPGERVALIAATGLGSSTLPASVCTGTCLNLDGSAWLLMSKFADAAGAAQFTGVVPAAACGRVYVQALSVGNCETSNVSAIP